MKLLLDRSSFVLLWFLGHGGGYEFCFLIEIGWWQIHLRKTGGRGGWTPFLFHQPFILHVAENDGHPFRSSFFSGGNSWWQPEIRKKKKKLTSWLVVYLSFLTGFRKHVSTILDRVLAPSQAADYFPGVDFLHPHPRPKFNSEFSPEKWPGPKRKGLSSNHHFSGSMLNFRHETISSD